MAPKAQKTTVLGLTALASTSMAFPQINSDYASAAYVGPSGIASVNTGGYSFPDSYSTGTAYSYSDSYPTSTGYSYTDGYPTGTYTSSYPTATGETCGDISNLDSRCKVLSPYVGQNDLAAVCSLFLEAQSGGCDCGGGSSYSSYYPGTTPTASYPGSGPSQTDSITLISATATFCADCPTSLGGNGGSPYPTGTDYVSASASSDVATASLPSSVLGSQVIPSGLPSDTYSASVPTGTGITYASPVVSSAVDTPLIFTSSGASATAESEILPSLSCSENCTDVTATATPATYATPTSVSRGSYGAASS